MTTYKKLLYGVTGSTTLRSLAALVGLFEITKDHACSRSVQLTINLDMCALLVIDSFLQSSLKFVIFTTNFHQINLMSNARLHQSRFFQFLYTSNNCSN